MSMKLMALAMDVKVGNPLRKLVLLKLCDNANDQGECWPSFQHIADQCEISKRSAINHVQALKEDGFLKVEPRFKDGEKISNLYLIDLGKKYKKVNENLGEGSAGGALPPSAADATGGAGDSLPSAGGALPPSAGDAHRTSHSFESVNEPVITKKKFPDWFLDLLNRYPPRAGSNDKHKAFRAVSARLKEGATIENLIAAVDRYRLFVVANGRINTEFTMQASTFFGPGGHIENLWSIPNAANQFPIGAGAGFRKLGHADQTRADAREALERLNGSLGDFVVHPPG